MDIDISKDGSVLPAPETYEQVMERVGLLLRTACSSYLSDHPNAEDVFRAKLKLHGLELKENGDITPTGEDRVLARYLHDARIEGEHLIATLVPTQPLNHLDIEITV